MFNNLFNRIFRAIKIDVELYEEVEKDKSATIQAGIVVVLSSLAAGVGALQLGVSNFILAPILSLLSWYVWAYVIYFVGVKLFGGPTTKSNHGELFKNYWIFKCPWIDKDFWYYTRFNDRNIYWFSFLDVSLYGSSCQICFRL